MRAAVRALASSDLKGETLPLLSVGAALLAAIVTAAGLIDVASATAIVAVSAALGVTGLLREEEAER